jgi:hypothetical protein
VTDTYTEDLGINLSYFSPCNSGTCSTESLGVSSGIAVSTLSLSVSSGIMSVASTDISLVGNIYTVYYKAIPPPGSLTNCVYYTDVRTLKID